MYDAINDMVWRTQDGRELRVGDMTRDHIRNCLHFCNRKHSELGDFEVALGIPVKKDGHRYPDWIAAFTAKLLDPELGE